jgi:hypothetical protein
MKNWLLGIIIVIICISVTGCYMGELNTYNDVFGVQLAGKSVSNNNIYYDFLCGTIVNSTDREVTVRWHDHRLSRVTDMKLLPGESIIVSYMIHDEFSVLVNGVETLIFTPTVTYSVK